MQMTITKPGKPLMSRLWYSETKESVGVMQQSGNVICIVTGRVLVTSAQVTDSNYEGDWENLPVGTVIKFIV